MRGKPTYFSATCPRLVAKTHSGFVILSSFVIRHSDFAPGFRLKSARAFTLIELILVMALLAVVLAVSAPSLSKFFKGRTLDSEARRFVSLTHYGQSRAVSEGVPMMLWIDTKERTYGLQEEVSYTDLDTKAVDFELGKDLQVEVTDYLAQSGLSDQSLQSRQPLQIVQGGQVRQAGRNLATIRFLPDGFIGETSPQSVLLREGDRDLVWITQSRNRLNYEIQTNAFQKVRR